MKKARHLGGHFFVGSCLYVILECTVLYRILVQYSTVHIRGGGVAPELTDYVLKLGL